MENSHTSDAFEYFFKNGYRCRYVTADEEKQRKEGRPANWLQEGYTLKVVAVQPIAHPEDNLYRGGRFYNGDGYLKNVPTKVIDKCFDVVDLIQIN